jgi:hypothetical protein
MLCTVCCVLCVLCPMPACSMLCAVWVHITTCTLIPLTQEENEALWDASQRGDQAGVAAALESGADMDWAKPDFVGGFSVCVFVCVCSVYSLCVRCVAAVCSELFDVFFVQCTMCCERCVWNVCCGLWLLRCCPIVLWAVVCGLYALCAVCYVLCDICCELLNCVLCSVCL